MNVQSVEGASHRLVTKTFQCRPQQCAAAVALIGEAQLGFELQAVSLDARLQGLQLTGDRIGIGLLFR